jgi:hypothetical protein
MKFTLKPMEARRTRGLVIASWTIAVTLLMLSAMPDLSAQVPSSILDASPAGWIFVHVAEGFASRDAQHGIDVGYRMFTAPTFGDACEQAPRPARLEALQLPIVLRLGEWFSFDRLVVVAHDRDGRVLGPVPIELEVEEQYPPLLNLQSDLIADGGVWPVAVGRVLFRARTICPGLSLAVVLPARIDKN